MVVPSAARTSEEPIAVIGVGAVMPMAPTARQFWHNVLHKVDAITEVPRARWDPELYFDADAAKEDKTYAKIGAFVSEYKFSPLDFRIPPNMAASLDAVQKMALAAVKEALEDAGLLGANAKKVEGHRVAVILGNSMGGEIQRQHDVRVYVPELQREIRLVPEFMALPHGTQQAILDKSEFQLKARMPRITEDSMPGELSNVIAGRIAQVFNFTGKNFTTDAACASSLAAIDAAAKALRAQECDLVVCGGSDRSMDVATYVKFSKIGALSADGSFPFDERANGFVMGEGSGILILKRLRDAVRDQDRIYAVVRGVGSSSDGKGKGITAPNPDGQRLALRRAYEDAQVTPDTVQLVEAHGTSTKVGDVVEVDSLGELFAPFRLPPRSVALGSVKSQIGHLKSAAGAASLIKVAFALREKTLPPTIHCERPSPNINWAATPLYPNTEAKPWPKPANGPRRAGVSSFGFGGTNFHVVLEEYDPEFHGRVLKEMEAAPSTTRAATTSGGAGSERPKDGLDKVLAGVIVVEGDSPADLERRLDLLRNDVGSVPADTDIVAVRGRAAFADVVTRFTPGRPHAVAFAAANAKEFAEKAEMARAAVGDAAKRRMLQVRGVWFREDLPRGKVAFVFPGQGSQYVGMLGDLRDVAEIRAVEAEADRVMTPLLGGKPLSAFVQAAGMPKEAAEEAIKQTEITQPAVLAVDEALRRALERLGLVPDVVAGHSLGEYGALVAAGAMPFPDALHAVSARGREMASVNVPDKGLMAGVMAPYEALEPILRSVPGYVVPANKNSKKQTVIAGESAAVRAAVEAFKARGIEAQFIPVSHAFHSRIVAPAAPNLRNVLERLDVRGPRVPTLCNVNADYYPNDRTGVLDLLERQIASPVEWRRQIERLWEEGVRTFVEIGPKAVLTAFTKDILEGQPHLAVPSNHPKKGGVASLRECLAALAAAGVGRETRAAPSAGAAVAVPAPGAASSEAENAIAQAERRLRETFDQLVVQLRAAQPNRAQPQLAASTAGFVTEPIVVTGYQVGLPGTNHKVFEDSTADRVLQGVQMIEPLPEHVKQAAVDKNVVRLVKTKDGDGSFQTIKNTSEAIQLMGRRGQFDLADWGIDPKKYETWDITTKLAVAAGLEALREAGIPLQRKYVRASTGQLLPAGWELPDELRDDTGIIFASAWPGLDNFAKELGAYYKDKYGARIRRELEDAYASFIHNVSDPAARTAITNWFTSTVATLPAGEPYTFNRKFLFSVLSMGHPEFAELIKARGPNVQVNAACSTTTLATAIAKDWIRTGRAKRILIIAADDPTSEHIVEWMGAGFLAAGAGATDARVEDAALPFDRRRHGMIVGMGAVGIVLETLSGARERGVEPVAELIACEVRNSAYHGSRLEVNHVAETMERLVKKVEQRLGLSRAEIAAKTLFMSHETYTPARGGSASAEATALRRCFGEHAGKVLITNTKGFTGHPNGAGIEDAIALAALQKCVVPPIANLRERDPEFDGLLLSTGGSHDREFALRLSAGFGSQIAFSFFRVMSKKMSAQRVDRAAHAAWVARVSGVANPQLEVVNRTLRIKDAGPAAATVAAAAPRPQAAAPAVVPSPTPAPAPVAPAAFAPARLVVPAVAPSADRGSIEARVVDLMAQKTGYPKELLDPNLDLEADLGIDTVKQAELFGTVRDQFALPKDEGLKIRDLNTIAKIVDYIADRIGPRETESEGFRRIGRTINEPAGSSATAEVAPSPTPTAPAAATPTPVAHAPVAASPPQPVASVAAPSPARAGTSSAGSRGEVLEKVKGLVSQKTGYTSDLLDPNLDLEADLGIDTVKQAELFGLVRQTFNIPALDGLKIRDYPTLNRVTDFVLENTGAPAAAWVPPAPVATPATSSAPLAPALAPAAAHGSAAVPVVGPVERVARRLVVTAVPSARPSPSTNGSSLAGLRLALVGDLARGRAEFDAVARALRDRGATVLPVDAAALATPEAAHRAADDVLHSGKLHAVAALGAPGLTPRYAFFAQRIAQATTGDVRIVAALVREGGAFGLLGGAPDMDAGALAGFTKGLGREFEPARVVVVDVDPAVGLHEAAGLFAEELAHESPQVEVAYTRDQRFTLALAHEGPTRAGKAVAQDSVLLVSGGAQGITAAIAKGLARSYGCALVLLGRTPAPADVERAAAVSDVDLAAERSRVTNDLKARGERVTPVVVDREVQKLVKARDVARTLLDVRAAGGRAHYVECDVTSSESVARAVAEAKARFGKVTGLVHAAGLEESKLLAEKKPDAWLRIYDTKVKGAANLLAALANEPLGLVALFSSVAGRFGNRGQTDYSAANEALNHLARRLRRERPEALVKSFLWTAWADVGMATRGSVMTVLKAAGVDAMTPAEGVAHFLEEVARPSLEPEVLVAGNLGAFAGALGGDVLARGLLDRAEVSGPRVVATVRFDPDAHAFLDDHAIEGTPVLPGVMGLEIMAEAASLLAPGLAFAGFADAEFRLPVKFPNRQAREVRVVAERAGDDAFDCRVESDLVAPGGAVFGEPRLHHRARVRFAVARNPATAPNGATAARTDLSKGHIYGKFFHGPRFQVLGGASHLDANGVKAVPVAPVGTQLRDGEPRFTSEPLPTEACFQAAGLHGREQQRVLALPVGLRAVTRFGDEPLFEPSRTVRARFVRKEEQDLVYDVEFVDAAGRVLLGVDGLRLRTFAAVADSPAASPKPAPAHGPRPAATPPTASATGDLAFDTVTLGPLAVTKVRIADVVAGQASLLGHLTASERDHYAAVTADKRRGEWLAGVLAAKQAAAKVAHVAPRSIEVTKEPSGRPVLRIEGQGAAPSVSVAHAGEFAFAAVGPGAFGIDFEPVVARDAAWRREAFGSAELDAFGLFALSLGESEETIETVAWCAKEASLKALGTGLRVPLRQAEVLTIELGRARVAYKANAWEVHWSKDAGGVLAVAVPAAVVAKSF